jgi:hypothetical protein
MIPLAPLSRRLPRAAIEPLPGGRAVHRGRPLEPLAPPFRATPAFTSLRLVTLHLGALHLGALEILARPALAVEARIARGALPDHLAAARAAVAHLRLAAGRGRALGLGLGLGLGRAGLAALVTVVVILGQGLGPRAGEEDGRKGRLDRGLHGLAPGAKRPQGFASVVAPTIAAAAEPRLNEATAETVINQECPR